MGIGCSGKGEESCSNCGDGNGFSNQTQTLTSVMVSADYRALPATMCPCWPHQAGPGPVLRLCCSSCGNISALLLNRSAQLKEMNPRSRDSVATRSSNRPDAGFILPAVAMTSQFPGNCPKIVHCGWFRRKSGPCGGRFRPIVARLRRLDRAGDRLAGSPAKMTRRPRR